MLLNLIPTLAEKVYKPTLYTLYNVAFTPLQCV